VIAGVIALAVMLVTGASPEKLVLVVIMVGIPVGVWLFIRSGVRAGNWTPDDQ
jgi:hypothetical protein